MRNTAEKQLSWFTLLLTAFYSLLASCRGEECGHEELASCARPLGKITNNNELGFVATKEELTALCPDLEAGMKCIKMYTLRCMAGNQRTNFNNLYKGVNMAIIELCQEGPYQDAFLKHAPCMQTVQADYEMCSKKYQNTVLALDKKNQTRSSEPVKSICCAFQEYLDCSHHTVRRKCGDETAEFTKNFLDLMANSLIKMHCARYTNGECAAYSAAPYTAINASLLLVVGLMSRYFT
ncbi:uncharacterized protein LOC107040779 [Diachasma alloeum]|uniref:uncharacterized protein LOC107040779 n=1 Tax=Diachasma alloeum TaxID=454923 RepID=UPI00073825D3|nr:uncharacterized protein LOC107040779 [Diachasma alloeum]